MITGFKLQQEDVPVILDADVVFKVTIQTLMIYMTCAKLPRGQWSHCHKLSGYFVHCCSISFVFLAVTGV